MLHDLTGKVAVIAGADSPIGAETARLMARQGAAVVLAAAYSEALEALRSETASSGARALAIAGDVTEAGFADSVCERAKAELGGVDILVNCTDACDKSRAASRTSDELWLENIALNETVPFRFCRAALKYMSAQGAGAIVNVSSVSGVRSLAGAANSSAKAALIGLTKNIGVQYAGTGIRCNCVCPGAVGAFPDLADAELDRAMAETVFRRVDTDAGASEPIDIANAILFLASDEARYINGQYLVIDRGSCI